MSAITNPPGPLRFISATVVRDDLVFVLSQVESLIEREVDHTKVLRWKSGSWAHYMLDWPAIAIAHLNEERFSILSLGMQGKVHVASGSSKWIEEIDLSRERPENRGPLRDIRTIGGACYACGMQRQVYRRLRRDLWERRDSGVVLPLGAQEILSFDSIHGVSEDEIYAVGLEGGIWRLAGTQWSQLDSPTSAWLEKVLCVAPGHIFACGQLGTLVEGRGDAFRVIDTLGVRDTFRDMCWFRNALYVSSNKALYRWSEKGWETLDLGLGSDWSFGYLACNENVIWSIGSIGLAMSSDGERWIDTTCLDGSY